MAKQRLVSFFANTQPGPHKVMPVRVALVQSPSVLGDTKANIERLDRQCRLAASDGAKIIVLPETSLTGYLSEDLKTNWHLPGRPLDQQFTCTMDPRLHAEAKDGPSSSHFSALAAELDCYITVPFLECDPDTQCLYNSVSLVSPAGGAAVAHYRKNCPWPVPEKSWATPANDVDGAYHDTPWGRVGLAICFDIHTILAKYRDKNLWALLYPIAWVGSTDAWFGWQLPHKLRQANCPHHILGANWATRAPPSWDGAGGSTVYGPRGQVLATAPGCWREALVFADLPTRSEMEPDLGLLDLTAYGEWSAEQRGTTYWHPDDVGPLSFVHDMRRMQTGGTHDAARERETDASFLSRTRAAQPWACRKGHSGLGECLFVTGTS